MSDEDLLDKGRVDVQERDYLQNERQQETEMELHTDMNKRNVQTKRVGEVSFDKEKRERTADSQRVNMRACLLASLVASGSLATSRCVFYCVHS
ncbi:hypothetical protein NDU88_005568 [Pleurodeles waltl]|uniref:Uncharacterized protein n=1 Tax=Pleurodeles waltl TaxID=8319 RepID=A0AAV7PJ93_PLEWA|nr:hypothetical protein NDU88_005568 [Pleurodeles waltl]